VGLAAAGLGALGGMRAIDVEEARKIETRMDRARQLLEGETADSDNAGAMQPVSLPALD
jgi:hypothetical protein